MSARLYGGVIFEVALLKTGPADDVLKTGGKLHENGMLCSWMQ